MSDKLILGRLDDITFGIDITLPNYDEWAPGLDVSIGDRFSYADVNYRVIQGHTTQTGWEPSETPALFAIVRRPFDSWVQPLGSHDAYPALDDNGEQMTCVHNDSAWINTHGDDNVWEPGVFGWSTVNTRVATVWIYNPTDSTIGITLTNGVVTIDDAPGNGMTYLEFETTWESWPNFDDWQVYVRWPA